MRWVRVSTGYVNLDLCDYLEVAGPDAVYLHNADNQVAFMAGDDAKAIIAAAESLPFAKTDPPLAHVGE